jgi:hypothetical protein
LRLHAVLADEREAFGHRDHRAAEDGVVRELDRGRTRFARDEDSPADDFEQLAQRATSASNATMTPS